jgi:hypothetical protein
LSAGVGSLSDFNPPGGLSQPPTYQPTFAVLDAMGEHHTEADGGWGGLGREKYQPLRL